MNTLFYTCGSGLGHLNRVLSFIERSGYKKQHCVILTNSNHFDFVPEEIKVFKISNSYLKNDNSFFEEFVELIHVWNITELVVDVFPSGLFGELRFLDSLKMSKVLLGRILKQEYFLKYQTVPFYDKLIIVEDGLELSNYRYGQKEKLQIKEDLLKPQKTEFKIFNKPFFLVLHSGPANEVLRLYEEAKKFRVKDEHIYIQTFCAIHRNAIIEDNNVTIIYNERPYSNLLEASGKIFTGCGFNTFWSLQKYRDKHECYAYHRLYDDQYKRKRLNTLTIKS